MAFNWQTFKTRALSAVVFVIVMMAGLLWNHWSFLLLFSIIHFGCWIEYQKLVEKIDPKYAGISPLHRYGVMLAGWGFMLWMTNQAYDLGGFSLSDAGFWMLVGGAIAVNIETLISRRGKLIAHSLMGLLYISLGLGLIVSLANPSITFDAPSGAPLFAGEAESLFIPFLPLVVIASMWVNDTMAYIVGSLIGRTPFSKISPKKTWEGTIGGALLTIVVVGYLAGNIQLEVAGLQYQLRPIDFYFIGGIAAVFGTLGDLFESKLKRLAGVKDSGQMMPGHGGFLDRFDSLLLATPFVWLYVRLAV